MKRALVAIGFACLVPACKPSSPSADDVTVKTRAVVFGDVDTRADLDAFANDLAVWKWADATAVMTSRTELCRSFSSEDVCFLDGDPISANPTSLINKVNLCHAEPFAAQRTLITSGDHIATRAVCTAFLVGDDLMLTAGHCVQPDGGDETDADGNTIGWCSDVTIAFGYDRVAGRASNTVIRRSDQYGCQEIVARQRTGDLDYALVRTDRAVIGHHRLRLRRSGTVSSGTSVVLPAHPLGLALKVDALGAVVTAETGCSTSATSNCLVESNYNSNGGSSGAPLINRLTGLVEAIHFAGPRDELIAANEDPADLVDTDLGSTACNVYRHCSDTMGCSHANTVAWSHATNIRALNLSQIPDLPAAGVRLLADFNFDSVTDTLSVAPSGGNYHFLVDYSSNGSVDADTDMLIPQSAIPPEFDLSWTITARDFDGDGAEDIISAFAGFAPIVLFGGSSLRAPQVSPFSTGISYGGFTVGELNGDARADLIAQNTLTGSVERFYGSDTGLVRAIDVPEKCFGPFSTTNPQRPQALAVALIPNQFLIPVPHAIFDCPGPNGLNQLMYFDLVEQLEAKIQPLNAGGNWRAFAHRRLLGDVLAVSDNGTEYSVYRLALNDPTPLLMFTKPLADGDRIGGVTWNEEDLRIHVVIDHVQFDPGESEIQILNESGNTGGVARVFDDCRNPRDESPARFKGRSRGLVAGAGVDTVACQVIQFDPVTIPMEIATNGSVTHKPDYLQAGPFDGDLSEVECDPLGGVLWGLSENGRTIYGKFLDFITTCPLPGFAPSFSELPPMGGGEWQASGVTLPVGADHSLLVNRAGYTLITGPLIAASHLQTIGTEVYVDVLVPSTPAAPAWAGNIQLLMSTPQAPNQSVGTADLTPLSRGQWHALRFPLTSAQAAAFANGVRDISFSLATNLPASAEPLHIGSMRFAGTLTVRSNLPTDDPFGRDPVFGFEDATLWSSSAALARDTSQVTQGSAALKVTGGNYNEITSRTFRTDGLGAPISMKVDVFVPQFQPNPYWFGDINAFVSCPSAGVNNAFLANRALTGLPRNNYSTLTFPVPANVGAALGSKRNDCTVKLALNVPGNAAPHRFDNLRFQ